MGERMGLILTQGLAIGGKEVPIYAYSYALAIDLVAGDANITVTNTDGSDYKVQWGDGEYTTQSSGVAATHTYASDYDGNIIIRSETPITALSSTDGDWDFNIGVLPDSITALDFGYASAAMTGAPTDLPASLVTLDLGGSACVLDGELDDLPEGLTSIDLNGTDSTLMGYLADLPSSLAYLDLSSTLINVSGDLSDLPASMAYLDLSDTASAITASGSVAMSSARAFYLQDTDMGSSTVDEVLAALATITTWVTEQAVNLAGNNASRSSSSDDDVTTLEGNSVTVTVNEDSPAYDDTTWIGEGARQNGSNTITVDFPAHSAGDILAFGVVRRHNDTFTTPSGWTELVTPQLSGSTDLTSIAMTVYYREAAGSGTTAVFNDAGNMYLSAGVALGSVDASAIVNAYQVTINSGAGTGVAATSHTFDGVVTTVPKARVVTFVGFGEDGANPDSWACAGLASITEEIDYSGTSGADCGYAVAQGVKTAAGDVGDTTATTAVSVESVAIQVAFTPTSSGGVPLPDAEATLAINQQAGIANLTITTDDSSTYTVEWGDGSTSAEIASGAIVSHAYASPYDGNVVVHSDGSVTQIRSDAGGWDFTLSSLPSTCTHLYFNNCADAAITGTLADLPAGFIGLYTFNTQCVITGDFGDEPATMTTIASGSCPVVIGGDFANATGAWTFIGLQDTASDAHFDLADLPSDFTELKLEASSCTVEATSPTLSITQLNRIDLDDLGLSTVNVDAILVALSSVTSWAGQKQVAIGGNNDGRTPATTDAAVTTLEGNGITVTANVIPDGGGEIVRVGITAQSIVVGGTLDLTGGSNDDQWREEIHDAEPMHSLAITYGTGPSVGLHANAPAPLEGTHWWSAYWAKDWPLRGGKVRTEIKRPNDAWLNANQEVWLGFATCIPDTADARASAGITGKTNNHIVQWHYGDPDPGTSGINIYGGRYKFSFGRRAEIDVGPVNFGQWEKWVVYSNMKTDSTGIVRMWLNPTVVDGLPVGDPDYEYTDLAICTSTGLYQKFGIYRFNSPLPANDIRYYYDSVRNGNSSSNFASVYPG